jgi:hypothetical protein
MPQLSSTDRLLMAANDMTDALQNPHQEVPFAHVGDDTTAALTDLAEIFKLKLRQPPSPATRASPAKVVPRPSLIRSSTQILNLPMPIRQQTRSQTTIHTQGIPNVPLPPRWSHLGHYVIYLRGCPPALIDSCPATCLKTTSAEWTPPTWPSPSEITIGRNGTKPTQ